MTQSFQTYHQKCFVSHTGSKKTISNHFLDTTIKYILHLNNKFCLIISLINWSTVIFKHGSVHTFSQKLALSHSIFVKSKSYLLKSSLCIDKDWYLSYTVKWKKQIVELHIYIVTYLLCKNRAKNTIWVHLLENAHISLEETGDTGFLEEGKLDGTWAGWEEVFSPQPFVPFEFWTMWTYYQTRVENIKFKFK